MPNYNQPHQFYAGVDLHARSMFVHVLSAKGKTVFERDLPAEPDAFLDAVQPFRKNLVVGCECMFAWYWLAVSLRHMSDPATFGLAPGPATENPTSNPKESDLDCTHIDGATSSKTVAARRPSED